MDNQSDITEDQEDEILLTKVDSMLYRHRQEQLSLVRNTDQQVEQVAEASTDPLKQYPSHLTEVIMEETSAIDKVPVLTDPVMLTLKEWPSQTEVSELLCFAFDAALKEAQINLNPAERLTLLRALGTRLPKNI